MKRCLAGGSQTRRPRAGASRKVFDPANAARLFKGERLVEPVPPEGVRAMLRRRVVRLRKGPNGGTKIPIETPDQAIAVSAPGRGTKLRRAFTRCSFFVRSVERPCS